MRNTGVYEQRMLTAFTRKNPVIPSLVWKRVQQRFNHCRMCIEFTGKNCKSIGCDFEDHVRILFKSNRECPQQLFTKEGVEYD